MVDVTELLPFQQPPITGTILLVMGSIIAALCFVAFLRTTHHEEQNQFDQKVK
ncbi:MULTISPECIES: hypothetical protein [Pontibacillus]|uniref:Uncharacterized protein n=1 Tax=Pontibacillus chungwhensis TaxID=265426 RepID=A0ABY8UTY9_9BACI|nr:MULTISPECIES: hypothetical protein [Pontibacillus]MCD5322827.1 hypothetical protein [Pontibacillus sp. HN14]WIF96226.1 hypothetical protein QNI29_10695 [Pontibacillus chungwhensis]